MRIQLNEKECCGCGACVSICPKHCFSIEKDEFGFSIAIFNNEAECIDCGACVKVCPQNTERANNIRDLKAVYGQTNDKDELLQSTSGAFFSVIAKYIIRQGGVCWGVKMNEDASTSYICIDSEEELKQIRGSKYVEIEEPLPYNKVKSQLASGQMVLVSGVPCQILALKKYIGNRYSDLLYTVDLFCYGVQSPAMWKCYLKEINSRNASISSISMRYKKKSWKDYSMKITYGDGKSYLCSRWNDPWLLSYATSLYNRESCASCEAKKFPKESDFTLGDFWGIEWYAERKKSIDRRKGVSIMFLHTKKAQELFKKITTDITYAELQPEEIEKLYPKLGVSHKVNSLRDVFLLDVKEKGFSFAVMKNLPHGMRFRYKEKIRFLKTLIRLKIKSIIFN